MMESVLPVSPDEFRSALSRRGRDRLIGIDLFTLQLPTKMKGRLRSCPEDFIVSEVLTDGAVATPVTIGKREAGGIPTYVLSKRNIDTPTAAREFSSVLRLKPWETKYLGLKDRRAVTFQFLSPSRSCHDPPPFVRGKSWEARLYAMSDRCLRPSDLCGNLFWIFMRLSEPMSEHDVLGILAEFKSRVLATGMINFFGYQRFGSRKPINHIVGCLICRREYDTAVRMMLGTPHTAEPSSLSEARQEFLDGRSKRALSDLVRSDYSIERSLARNMMRFDGDSKRSILRLPSNLLRFLLQSLSAFIFNSTASHIGHRLLLREVQEDLLYVPLDRAGSPTTACARPTPSSARAIKEALGARRSVPAITSPGFLAEKAVHEESRRVMDELEIKCESFHLRERPEAGYPGRLRAAVVMPKIVSAVPFDEMSVFLSFFLPTSSYATVLLRELIHN